MSRIGLATMAGFAIAFILGRLEGGWGCAIRRIVVIESYNNYTRLMH